MAASFPRQDIPELKKDLKWCGQHLDYAEYVYKNSNNRRERFTRLYNSYNGKESPASVRYMTHAYGKKNKTRYISYRVGRPKIDLINNEFLLRPLKATVSTINQAATTAKLEHYELMVGAVNAKQDINKLKEFGVDPLEGMDVPDEVSPEAFSSLNFKDKNESLMQTIINHQIPKLKMKEKLTKNFQDMEIVSMCYGKVDVDFNGNEYYKKIDPRRAIFEEIEGDTFLEKSPIMGEREEMSIHQVLMTYELTETQRDKLEQMRTNGGELDNYSDYYKERNSQFLVGVITIEWLSVEPIYYKISPKTKTQLEFDSSTKTITKEISPKEYEKNKKKYDKDVAAGKYEIITKYKQQMWEATRIGHDIDINCRKKENVTRSVDNPGDVTSGSYMGALLNTVNGERISLQEIIDNFSNIFDITMFQILRDLNKAKGKVLGYNRAALPKGKTVKGIMYDALNDSFVDYDTSAAGNRSGRDLDLKSMFQEFDLGLSDSFPSLIALKQEILVTLDRLTGINENREGQIAASSTATNAQSAIRASRTITEGMFYIMSLYVEKVLIKLCETTKITWGINKPEKARIVLGDEKFSFMKVTQNIAYADYGIVLTDGGKELELRQKLETYAEASINSKDIRFVDKVAFDMTETLAEGREVLKKAWEEMDKIRQRDAQVQNQAAAENQEKAMQTQIQIAKENREDNQAHDERMSSIDADNEIRVDQSKARNDMFKDSNKIEQENTFGEDE